MTFTLHAVDGDDEFDREFLVTTPPSTMTPAQFFDVIFDWISGACLTSGPPNGLP